MIHPKISCKLPSSQSSKFRYPQAQLQAQSQSQKILKQKISAKFPIKAQIDSRQIYQISTNDYKQMCNDFNSFLNKNQHNQEQDELPQINQNINIENQHQRQSTLPPSRKILQNSQDGQNDSMNNLDFKTPIKVSALDSQKFQQNLFKSSSNNQNQSDEKQKDKLQNITLSKQKQRHNVYLNSRQQTMGEFLQSNQQQNVQKSVNLQQNHNNNNDSIKQDDLKIKSNKNIYDDFQTDFKRHTSSQNRYSASNVKSLHQQPQIFDEEMPQFQNYQQHMFDENFERNIQNEQIQMSKIFENNHDDSWNFDELKEINSFLKDDQKQQYDAYYENSIPFSIKNNLKHTESTKELLNTSSKINSKGYIDQSTKDSQKSKTSQIQKRKFIRQSSSQFTLSKNPDFFSSNQFQINNKKDGDVNYLSLHKYNFQNKYNNTNKTSKLKLREEVNQQRQINYYNM